MRCSFLPMLSGLAALVLLAAGDCARADEFPQDLFGQHAARVDELEKTVSDLQSQIDALQNHSFQQQETGIPVIKKWVQSD